MTTLDDVRAFLARYQQNNTYPDDVAVPQEGDQPPDLVCDWQRSTVEIPDEHVISVDSFEFRIAGRDDDYEPDSRYVHFEDAIGAIERGWDQLISKYGLDAISTYIPFHEDEENYGIYIQQRGIRFLGHLLYQWSRVGDLTDTPAEATEYLLENGFQDGDRLFQGEPQFDTVEDAFALAQEILLRHHWFHHQVELLAAYTEDAADTLYYPAYYHQQLSAADIGGSREEAVANAYVARSRACQNKSPQGLFDPLFRRVVSSRRSTQQHFSEYTESFAGGCYEVSRQLLAEGGAPASRDGIALARELVFETSVSAAIPSRISAYVTRKESDSYNASYAQNEHPWDENQNYTLCRDDRWKEAYDRAEGSITQQVDAIVDQLEENPHQVKWKGRGVGPKQRYYGNINRSKRFIFEVDEKQRQVRLLDFGDHDLPDEYGLHKH